MKSDEFKNHQYSSRYKELKKLVKAEKKEAIRKKIDAAVDKAGGTMSWMSHIDALLDPDADKL